MTTPLSCYTEAIKFHNMTGREAIDSASRNNLGWLLAQLNIPFPTREEMYNRGYCGPDCEPCLRDYIRTHEKVAEWLVLTDARTVYHLIMPDATVTFLTEEARDRFVADQPTQWVVPVESMVSVVDYEQMERWQANPFEMTEPQSQP